MSSLATAGVRFGALLHLVDGIATGSDLMNRQRSSSSASILHRSVFAMLLCCGWVTAHAATSCVSSPLQLAIALNVAQNNGEDDYIQLEVGNYLLGGELDYVAAAAETHALTISGGWAPGCFVRSTSGSSALDGQHLYRPLYISARGNVGIIGVTFQNGNPALYAGGALNVSSVSGSIISVDSSVFVNNQCATTSGGAVYLTSPGTMILRNNLVFANTGGSTVLIDNNAITDINNNTFVGNQLANHVGLGALDLAGTGQYYISNNILWNNEGNDLYDQNGTAYFYNNDIGLKDGFAPAGEYNGLSVDPQFEGFLSVRPAPSSPLVNAGLDSPYGGTGTLDLAGSPRLIGKHVDIGAYETDVLFRDGLQ
jgi:hypothetical protein